ncbi:hypothetical protein [Streptomyces sp. YU58]|uniref:hypothetical protein n=1 Tax=Streptomyces sp. SX92 TaxID=3158972 RepID=UPI0027BA0D4B|nr:hypothetical protein [Streptomyces coralus]WLW58268.1 hypothetical protein QU709_46015 [Streptomyces coralus]
MDQLICSRTQLEGIAAALSPDQLAGSSPEERSAREELCADALQLPEDAEAAADSGELVDVLIALVNAIDGLAGQLRDRVLDQVVESSPPPDSWPL